MRSTVRQGVGLREMRSLSEPQYEMATHTELWGRAEATSYHFGPAFSLEEEVEGSATNNRRRAVDCRGASLVAWDPDSLTAS